MSKSNNLATKTFVKAVVERTEGKLRHEINDAKEGLRNEIKKNHNELSQKIGSLHNEVMGKLDSIAGSFKKFDEEQTVLSYRVSKHTNQLENHEKRIRKIEKTPLSS